MYCNAVIRGRSDKKFCDDFCRNSYNNRLKSHEWVVRDINSLLRRNRRILKSIYAALGTGTPVSRETLLQQGFHFEYHTHTKKQSDRAVIYFCYEYGFSPLQKEYYRLHTEAKHELQRL
jgi:hypothetical protein